ncbi:ANR family transcriptional regulator [Photobacterium piscicola]|uniref:ANR family transcriptional regulator n=1 Tax=Photobacterium piscicola TaxID=1378299 RepID=UPI003736FDBF
MSYKLYSESAVLHEKHENFKVAKRLWEKAAACRTTIANRQWAWSRAEWCGSYMAQLRAKARKK